MSETGEESESKKLDSKICGVCGDKALGYNFNAITCESCKAFFRRNALRNKEFKCPFEGNCKVDVVTRRFCQRCRLKRCFDIGMKKEWIMTEDEKRVKRSKIEENRQKRHATNTSKSADSTTSTIMPNIPAHNVIQLIQLGNYNQDPPAATGGLMDESPAQSAFASALGGDKSTMGTVNFQGLGLSSAPRRSSTLGGSGHKSALRSLLAHDNNDSSTSGPSSPITIISERSPSVGLITNNNSNNRKFSESSFERGFVEKHEKEEIEMQLNSFGSSIPESVFRKTVEVEFSPIPIRQKNGFDTHFNRRELNSLEKMKLQELVLANEVLKMPVAANPVNNNTLPSGTESSVVDVVKMTDYAIRRLIKMSKKLSAFKNLCQEDQIALLKGGSTEMMVLRSVMSYNEEKETWEDASHNMFVKLEVLKQAKGNIYEAHKKFVLSFDESWRSDDNIMLILCAITLFCPTRSHVVHSDLIKLEQQTYIYLLQRYLETKYTSACEAKNVYLKLMSKVEELKVFNENFITLYLNISPKEVETPLLIELFDLKH